MLHSARNETKAGRVPESKGGVKSRHSDPTQPTSSYGEDRNYLEKENAQVAGLLVATPIRVAMANHLGGKNKHNNYNMKNNNNNNNIECDAVVLRSTSRGVSSRLGSEDASLGQRTVTKRRSDSMKRRSGHQSRRTSAIEVSSKRNSDPVTLGAFASSVASLKALFGVGSPHSSEIEGVGFKRQNTMVKREKGKITPDGNFRKSSPHDKSTSKSSKTPAVKTPAKTYTAKTPVEKTPGKTPAKTSAEKIPTKTSAEKTPAKSSAEKIPAKTSAEKTSAKTSAGKTAKQTPGGKATFYTDTCNTKTTTTSSSKSTSKSEPQGRSPKKFFKGTSGTTRKHNDATKLSPESAIEVEGNSDKKWTRSNSLIRPFHHRSRHNSGHALDPSAHSDTEIGKISTTHSLLDGECGSVGGSVTSERGIDVGRVAAWATSFEKLLEDPAGLHTFAEFLKKEYSHENIYFWTACERYKRLSNPDELQATAKDIFQKHLCIGASEPVNVDSQARQDAQDSLHNPNEFLFSQAQKQIFNLMKFDSYSRFLKSSLYQDCLSRDMRGQTLPYPGDDTLDPGLKIIQDDSHVTLKKSKSDADERRRKSLLPWHRKDRSKSKDRGEAEYRRRKKMGQRNQSDSSSVRSDMSGSRTSLNSSDLALGRRAISKESLTSGELGSLSSSEGYNRCRVILPDLSNSVVAVRHGENIQELLARLLERRGISYSTFDVYQSKTDKLMDKTEDSTVLGGLEVRLEQRILFRLDLPNRKTVCVKAKPNKLTCEVLKPILHKYGYKLDLMSIHKVGEEKGVNLKCHVNEIDGDRLVVQTKEEVKEWGVEPARQKKRGNTLDEITNRVFEDLLKGKSEQNFDELGVLDFDARSSRTEHSSDRSSGVTGGFSLRNSLAAEKDMSNKPRKPMNRASVHDGMGVRGLMPPSDHALITKRRGNNNNPANAKQENDELYEGLKRAQRSRLDDQRGTEINFELPDFLKCDQPEDKENQHAHLADQLLAHLECSFSDGGVIPSHQEAEDYFSMAHPEVWGGIPASSGPHSPNATLMAPDLDLDDFDDTLIAEQSLSKVPLPDTTSTSLHIEPPDFSPPPPISMENSVPAVSRLIPPSLQLSPPPPLPPKPKLGGTRGPPPRPPSRQLHLLNPPTFSSTSDDDDALHASDPPIHISRQGHDKFNISFV